MGRRGAALSGPRRHGRQLWLKFLIPPAGLWGMNVYSRFLLAAVALLLCVPASAATKNGFELEDPLIPVDEIISGGPPRDGIPAINEPTFVDPDEAGFMDEDDRVMGVVIDGVARAYPIKILNWHEAVNDKISTQHFIVTYCPLCGSGMVFASNAGKDGRLVFGISGLLYDSDVLLFDRNTESLWSQLMGKAVSGPLKGTDLPQLPARHTTWGDWLERHPGSQVMSTETGFGRSYERSPYERLCKIASLVLRCVQPGAPVWAPRNRCWASS
ncbi:MAG: DUF3179 domain-containing protein [Gammaproteobacteria bacterium]|nr:DUF3179 domain-containing protein [Gammaproteobacteria bacterium]